MRRPPGWTGLHDMAPSCSATMVVQSSWAGIEWLLRSGGVGTGLRDGVPWQSYIIRACRRLAMGLTADAECADATVRMTWSILRNCRTTSLAKTTVSTSRHSVDIPLRGAGRRDGTGREPRPVMTASRCLPAVSMSIVSRTWCVIVQRIVFAYSMPTTANWSTVNSGTSWLHWSSFSPRGTVNCLMPLPESGSAAD